jgi:hypothetical protein
LRPILVFSFLIALFLAVGCLQIWYWQKIDAEGGVMRCTLDSKEERIDKTSHSDAWTPLFRVTLACPWTNANVPMFLPFDTDEQEFDRLQRGAAFDVRYLSVPLGYRFLGVSAAHPARESADMHAATLIARFRPLMRIAAYLAILALLIYIVSKHRVPGARWALGVVVCVGVIWLLMPTLPITVSGKLVPATATVKDLHTFTQLLETSKSEGIPALTPYALVVLQFVPAGRHEPVLAADMIDIASHKGLAVGQSVAIEYEAEHPRRANIQHATRLYYWTNVEGAFFMAVMSVGFLVGGSLLIGVLRQRAKQAWADAQERARDRALLVDRPRDRPPDSPKERQD